MPCHMERGMDGHLEDCVGSRIFVWSINSLFPCGCIAGTDSTADRGVKINLCVCVWRFGLCVCWQCAAYTCLLCMSTYLCVLLWQCMGTVNISRIQQKVMFVCLLDFYSIFISRMIIMRRCIKIWVASHLCCAEWASLNADILASILALYVCTCAQ